MLRRIVLLILGGGLVFAGILPEGFEGAARKSLKPVLPGDPAVWEEYGLEAAEQGVFEKGGATFTITAYRLRDPTSALGVYQWKRPADGRPRELKWPTMKTEAVETATRLMVLAGNYVLDIDGFKPAEETLSELFVALPKVDLSALPALPGFLPRKDLVAYSERYVVGPSTLEKFEPRLRPSQVGFHLGAEAQLAKYRTRDGELRLVLISYPTPHIARARLEALEKIEGAMAKRSGILVGLILPPANGDAAERVLAGINWHANITWHENTGQTQVNFGDLLINIFVLTGLLVLACVGGGVLVSGARMVSRRMSGTKGAEDPMILLHLSDK